MAPVAIHGWSASTYILSFIALLNTLGGGALVIWIKSRGGWMKTARDAEAARRRQTDEVALDLVVKLTARVQELENAQAHLQDEARLERDMRDAREAALRHELRNVEGSIDGLLLQVLRHVEASIAPTLIELFAGWRADRRREAADRRGELRNEVQSEISAARVVADAKGVAA